MFIEDKHYSKKLETEILGACLVEVSAFARIYGSIEHKNFYNADHQMVFAAMTEMFNNNMPVILLSVIDYLSRVKNVELINGDQMSFYLLRLTEKVTSTANLEYYSLIIKNMWVDREVILLTSTAKNGNTKKSISEIQEKLNELNTINFKSDWKEMDELMMGLFEHQIEMEKTKGMGLLTGFKTIDKIYGGFFPGQMIVIGARPSVGKSAFAGQMAMNMARSGARLGFISLEMSNNEIAARFAALDTNIPFTEIFRGLYEDEAQQETFYKKISNSASKLPISVSDKTDVNISEIKAKAFKLKHKHGKLDCLILDYLQLVDGDSQANRNRENEVSKISRGCKIIAKEMQVPFIILAQLNREVDKRTYKTRHPQLSDFRETGAIEQDADIAMFLHSDFKSGHTEDQNGNTTEGQADIVIRKWRNGIPNLIIPLDFDGPKMRFKERMETRLPSNYRPVNYLEPKNEDLF